jgi:hypothetical protein
MEGETPTFCKDLSFNGCSFSSACESAGSPESKLKKHHSVKSLKKGRSLQVKKKSKFHHDDSKPRRSKKHKSQKMRKVNYDINNINDFIKNHKFKLRNDFDKKHAEKFLSSKEEAFKKPFFSSEECSSTTMKS